MQGDVNSTGKVPNFARIQSLVYFSSHIWRWKCEGNADHQSEALSQLQSHHAVAFCCWRMVMPQSTMLEV